MFLLEGIHQPPALPGAIDIQALTGLNKIMPKVNAVALPKTP
jgi:hypothetical protein